MDPKEIPSMEEFEQMLKEIGPEKMSWFSEMAAPDGPHEVDEAGDII
jgi:hypothetical protein